MFENIAAYRFIDVDDPVTLAASMRALAQRNSLRGTILVATEGINVFLAGEAAAIAAFVDGLRADPRFAEIPIKRSRSAIQPFRRLKTKVKSSITSFGQDAVSPVRGRARALAPCDLARWIARGHADDGRPLVLLDTRNVEEVAHGTFNGAVTLPITRFRDLPHAVAAVRSRLADATIVSFCTGGIRCEKAALWMQENGFQHVWQLDGGILAYFEQVGMLGFAGHCFVFDQRVALDSALAVVVPRTEEAVG